MSQQTRFQVVKQGGPTEVVTAPKPVIEAENEVLVKLKAVALQPIDWKQIDLGLMVQKWPHIMGLDGAGVVEQVGKAVTRFKAGDEVFGLFFGDSAERSSAYQEYAAVQEQNLALKPASLSFEEAASIPIGYLTALAGAFVNIGVPFSHLPSPKAPYQPGSILVVGGSSACGSAAVELLRIALPNATILATSSGKHHDLLSRLGADKSFERDAELESIRAATPKGQGVDVIYDIVNGAALRPSILDVLNPAGPKIFAEVMTSQNIEKVPEDVNHSMVAGLSLKGTPGLFEGLSELVASGKYKVPIATKVVGQGLNCIGKGIDELRNGVSGTKLIVKV